MTIPTVDADPLYSGNELHALIGRIEQEDRLDPPARALQDAVHQLVRNGWRKDLLSGTWLGHPLHPMLTDLPIGFWTSAWVLDILGPRKYRDAARILVGLGVLSAIPAAASGASDWSDTTAASRRIGLAHAAANGSAVALYLGSWVARRRGRHARGVMFGMAGAAAATVGGYLGGHLVQSLGTGVDANRNREGGPVHWTFALEGDALTDVPARVEVDGAALIVFRHRDEAVAMSAICPHRGAPLEEGRVVDGCIECPWHGSRFGIPTGDLARGPAASPLPRFEARVHGGNVEVRRGSHRDRHA